MIGFYYNHILSANLLASYLPASVMLHSRVSSLGPFVLSSSIALLVQMLSVP